MTVAEELFETAMARMSGDWGSQALAESADLLEDIAKEWPEHFLGRAPALVGTVLILVDDFDSVRAAPVLDVVGGESNETCEVCGLRTHRMMRGSAIHRLLGALKALASDRIRFCRPGGADRRVNRRARLGTWLGC